MSKLDEARLVAYLENYPREIAFGDDPERVYERYHAPDYVVVNDGLELGREQILQHAGPARRRVADVRVQVHEVLCCGSRFAARYTLEASMRKGPVVATEIHVLGEADEDGRLVAARQITRDVSPKV